METKNAQTAQMAFRAWRTVAKAGRVGMDTMKESVETVVTVKVDMMAAKEVRVAKMEELEVTVAMVGTQIPARTVRTINQEVATVARVETGSKLADQGVLVEMHRLFAAAGSIRG